MPTSEYFTPIPSTKKSHFKAFLLIRFQATTLTEEGSLSTSNGPHYIIST